MSLFRQSKDPSLTLCSVSQNHKRQKEQIYLTMDLRSKFDNIYTHCNFDLVFAFIFITSSSQGLIEILKSTHESMVRLSKHFIYVWSVMWGRQINICDVTRELCNAIAHQYFNLYFILVIGTTCHHLSLNCLKCLSFNFHVTYLPKLALQNSNNNRRPKTFLFLVAFWK